MKSEKKKIISLLCMTVTTALLLFVTLRFSLATMMGVSVLHIDCISYGMSFGIIAMLSVLDIILCIMLVKK